MSHLRPLLPALGAWWRGLPPTEHMLLVLIVVLAFLLAREGLRVE